MSSDFNNVSKLFSNGVVSIGNTPTEINLGTYEDGIEFVRIYNDGNKTMYFGGPSVTASGANKGEPLVKKQWAQIPVTESGQVYAIVASGSEDALVSHWGND